MPSRAKYHGAENCNTSHHRRDGCASFAEAQAVSNTGCHRYPSQGGFEWPSEREAHRKDDMVKDDGRPLPRGSLSNLGGDDPEPNVGVGYIRADAGEGND